MKSLVIYDSVYGNTEKIAQIIAKVLRSKGDVKIVKITDTDFKLLEGMDLLVVGSPTQAFNPLPSIKNWLKTLPKGYLTGKKVAAFDTRMDVKQVNNKFLTFMASFSGYAAEKIGKLLIQKGGSQVIKPQGFFVDESEGPITTGELDRAEKWAGKLM